MDKALPNYLILTVPEMEVIRMDRCFPMVPFYRGRHPFSMQKLDLVNGNKILCLPGFRLHGDQNYSLLKLSVGLVKAAFAE